MGGEILGISGSPVPNSNTDRLVLHVLQSSGLDCEFVNLSQLNIGPWRTCQACLDDSLGKEADDFPELAQKLQAAKGLVLGGNTPYGKLDMYMNTFLERLRSMSHSDSLIEPKYVAAIISGLSNQTTKLAHKSMAARLLREKIQLVAQLSIEENGLDVEDQPLWEKAGQAGKLMAQLITEPIECWLDYE